MTDHLSPRLSDAGACRSARQTLDLVRAGDESASGIEAVAEARRHLETCGECREFVHRRDRFDSRIRAALSDVPVPPDLAARLMASLALSTAEPVRVVADTEVPPPVLPATRGNRRHWIRRLAATVACLIVVGGSAWWALHRGPEKMSLDEWLQVAISEEVTADLLPTMELLADGSRPQLPATMKTRPLVDPPRRLADGRAAAYFFQFPARRGGGTVEGRLLVIPHRWVETPPSATAFLARPATYLGRQFCASAWVEGDFCYICLVKGGGGENELHTLAPARPVAT